MACRLDGWFSDGMGWEYKAVVVLYLLWYLHLEISRLLMDSWVWVKGITLAHWNSYGASDCGNERFYVHVKSKSPFILCPIFVPLTFPIKQ